MALLDKLPLVPLIIGTVFLGLAPFTPEPHLLEKLRMLSDGMLTKPMDIIDLVVHGGPAVVLVLKLVRMRSQRV